MSLFKNLKNEGLEEVKDSVGGGGFTREADIYEFTIKAMFAGKSREGAQFIQLIVNDADGKEYREQLYVTNKKGENFYLAKDKQGNLTGKKSPLPGFTHADHICLVALGIPLCEVETEEKVFNVYNADEKKEIPTAVQMITEASGKKVALAILKIKENKREKQGNEYVPIADTIEKNNIDKVFDPESHFTVTEAQNEAESAIFWDKWLESNKGKVRDKTKKDIGQAGAPKSSNSGGAPEAGAAPRKSLFGKK